MSRVAGLAKKRAAAMSPWSSNFKLAALAKSTANFVVSYNTVEVPFVCSAVRVIASVRSAVLYVTCVPVCCAVWICVSACDVL